MDKHLRTTQYGEKYLFINFQDFKDCENVYTHTRYKNKILIVTMFFKLLDP